MGNEGCSQFLRAIALSQSYSIQAYVLFEEYLKSE